MTDASFLHAQALAEIAASASLPALEECRIAWLGKKGRITEALKSLGAMGPDERKSFGAAVNAAKDEITRALESRKTLLEQEELNARLSRETLDVTLPARPEPQGRLHPVTQVIGEITAIFAQLGFAVAEGPDIEDDAHNFAALNFPEAHPAKEMHDTFFLNGTDARGSRLVLRTHTSPVQIRTMRAGQKNGNGPPFRALAPGATYRCDSDQTHTPMFHQVEGFAVDKGIHMGHLKWVIEEFLKAFFELPAVPLRFRPSFFPFTEPSAEVDIGCRRTRDELRIGEGSGPGCAGGFAEASWLEVMGCGMVHPNVLKNCGIDPEQWQGFAFGMGVERLAMLKYGIPDLRTFFESDVRWLNHYGFSAL